MVKTSKLKEGVCMILKENVICGLFCNDLFLFCLFRELELGGL